MRYALAAASIIGILAVSPLAHADANSPDTVQRIEQKLQGYGGSTTIFMDSEQCNNDPSKVYYIPFGTNQDALVKIVVTAMITGMSLVLGYTLDANGHCKIRIVVLDKDPATVP